MFRPLSKHNLSMFELAWKYTSISYVTSGILGNVTFNGGLKSKVGYVKKNFTSTVDPAREQSSVCELHKTWVSRFNDSEIPDPESSTRYIFEHVLGLNGAYQYELNQQTKITQEQKEQINKLCECRLARMPVQYIIKEWDFRELRLMMCPPVFIPRPETEELVDLVLATAPPDSNFLEIGCGSGAIALSLLNSLPQARVMALDQSRLACELTSHNAQLLGLTANLQVVQSKLEEDGNLSVPLPEGYSVDVLVSNPPYVPYAQLQHLQPEIKLYEDLRALEAGRDGLRVVKALCLLAKAVLRPGALIFLEVDSSHPTLIQKYLTDHLELNIEFVQTFKDFCGKDRFVKLKKN